jgi:hypothetical protein
MKIRFCEQQKGYSPLTRKKVPSAKHDAPGQDKQAFKGNQGGVVRLAFKKGGRTKDPDQYLWGV